MNLLAIAAKTAAETETTQVVADYTYILSAFLFIMSLKWMSKVKTSRRGNYAGTAAMILAVVGTMIATHIEAEAYMWIFGAIALGGAIGIPMAVFMPMTAVPQRTALSHAFGGLAVGMVGIAKLLEFINAGQEIHTFIMVVLGAEILLGFLTFTGSMVAFAKLQELISSSPVLYPGRNFVTLTTFLVAIGSAVMLGIQPEVGPFLYALIISSLLVGVMLVMPIGGADMPTVIAILNAYAGLSASAMGFVLNNKLLIIAGALDGSSGLILAIIMCKAMNRSFLNVLFGGVGQTAAATAGTGEQRTVASYTPSDAAAILDTAKHVIIVPGYGMAVAQAQHTVKELYEELVSRKVKVQFAIHPVAGRMPGHMNVLLAEADIPYEALVELDEINPVFPEADVAIVLGANDVCNPAARTQKDSPLYGMPILNVDKAHTVMVVKRSLGSGFAGIDNELFYLDKTMMIFGDAKKVVTEVVNEVKNG